MPERNKTASPTARSTLTRQERKAVRQVARPAGKPAQAAVDLVVADLVAADSLLAERWIQLRLVERVASLLESPGLE